jgi:hypothetical protein
MRPRPRKTILNDSRSFAAIGVREADAHEQQPPLDNYPAGVGVGVGVEVE